MTPTQNTPSADPPASVLGHLTWQEGGVQQERPITSEGLSIGRSSQNDLAVTDPAASRFHCKVLPEASGVVLVDLESRNGTYLNGARVNGSCPVHDGDQISIGQQVYTVQVMPAPPPPGGIPRATLELPLEDTYIVPIEENAPQLVVSSGMGKGTTFTLTKKRMQIGRASREHQWDIDLVDKSVSRPHAEILQQGTEWLVKDLGSANGVLLNNKKVKDTHPLKDGDVLELGETVLIFRWIGGG